LNLFCGARTAAADLLSSPVLLPPHSHDVKKFAGA
jgi:hypothetical protein